MAFDYNQTRTMLEAIERSNRPSATLVDTFFPNVTTFITNAVEIEYKKGGRKLAPFVVPGSKGVAVARGGSKISTYTPPIMKPKRLLTVTDIETRGFGENVYTRKSPEERAAEIRANDLASLIDMCVRRQEKMAADLLVTGKYDINGFADDGKTAKIDTIDFEFTQKYTMTGSETWDNPAAHIYDAIGDASQAVRRNAGLIPTVAICSANVVKYLLANTQLNNFLMVPNRDNLALMSLQPRLVRPDLMRVGMIQALNLEIYSYDGVYENDEGELAQYIPDNYMIIGVPGRGKRLFGAVTQMESDNAYHTYEGEYVPKYSMDVESDTSSLTVASRCVICPEFVDDWAVIKAK